MAMKFFMQFDGIQGDVQETGHQDKIEGYAFTHNISIPRDEKTGLPVGQSKHGAVEVVTNLGKHYPELQELADSGKHIGQVVIEFPIVNKEGKQAIDSKITLKNVQVQSATIEVPNVLVAGNEAIKATQRLNLTYDSIDWDHSEGKAGSANPQNRSSRV